MQLGRSLLVQRCSCRMGVDKNCTGYRGSISHNGGQHMTWDEMCQTIQQEFQPIQRLRSRRAAEGIST